MTETGVITAKLALDAADFEQTLDRILEKLGNLTGHIIYERVGEYEHLEIVPND